MAAESDGRLKCCQYFVVILAFLIIFASCGTIYSSPVIMVIFEKEFNTTYTVLEHSWLGATMMSSMSLSSILSMTGVRFVGCRGTIVIGLFLAALGPALAVFAKSVLHICLTVGLLTGTGVGLAFIPSLLTVELHFPKRGNRLATMIALSGIGVGVAAVPAILHYLVEAVDWLYCLLIMASAFGFIAFGSIMMRAPEGFNGKMAIDIFKEESVSRPAFLAVCVANFIWSFGSAIMYIYIPVYTRMSGHTTEEAAIMLSCIGGLSFFSRAIFRIMHLGEAFAMDTVTSVFCGLFLTAIFTGLFGEFSMKYTGLLSYSMLFGFYCGFWSNFINQVSRETVGLDVATGGSGFAMLATALGSLGGPPIAGFLYSETSEFKHIFYLAGSCMMFCSLLLLVVKLGQCPSSRFRDEIVRKINERKAREKVKEKCEKLSAQRGDSSVDAHLLTNV